MQREERVQELLVADALGFKSHLDNFGVAGLVGANILVAGPLQLAALITHRSGRHAWNGGEGGFHAPEAACSECCFFCAHGVKDARDDELVTPFWLRRREVAIVPADRSRTSAFDRGEFG